jgi:hypothetical protein
LAAVALDRWADRALLHRAARPQCWAGASVLGLNLLPDRRRRVTEVPTVKDSDS